MPAESSTAGEARRGRRASTGAPSTQAEQLDGREELAETSASSPRLEAVACPERVAGSPGKPPFPTAKVAVRASGRTSTRSGASAQQRKQPQTNGQHPAGTRPERPSKRQGAARGVWSRAATTLQQQVASAQLMSLPGAGVLLLAIALGAWLPSRRDGEFHRTLARQMPLSLPPGAKLSAATAAVPFSPLFT